MTTYVPPKKNTECILYVGLISQADTKTFQTNPTIAAGDFKVSTDGGALDNLDTIPAVAPAGGKLLKITLSAAEMNGDNIMVVGSDASGAEWCDVVILLQTAVYQIDGAKLASDGLDGISTTAPTGVASNFREMLVQTWRRFFKKSTKTDTQIKTYADNGTDVLTTQTISDDGTTETQGVSA